MKLKNYKRIVSIVLVFVLCFSLGMAAFCVSGNNDKYGGHFEKVNNCAGKYRYYEGENAGWELTFANPVRWEKRFSKLERPFSITDNSLGTWCKVGCQNSESPSQSIDPSPTNTSTTSTNPTTTSTSTLPQTGENNNLIPFVLSLVLVAIGCIILIKQKFSSVK